MGRSIIVGCIEIDDICEALFAEVVESVRWKGVVVITFVGAMVIIVGASAKENSIQYASEVANTIKQFKTIADKHRHIATDTLHHAVGFYANFYSGLYPHVAKIHGCFGHDVLAFIYLTNPELFTLLHGRVRVATEGIGQGQTMLDRRPTIGYAQRGWDADKPPTQVCMQVDAKAVGEVFQATMMADWLN